MTLEHFVRLCLTLSDRAKEIKDKFASENL